MTDDNTPEIAPFKEDFGTQLNVWVSDAFSARSDSKEFLFQVSVNMQAGAPMVFIWLRNAVIGGEVLKGGFHIDNPFTCDAAEIENAVRLVCERMLEGRSKILAEMSNGTPNGPTNGHPLLG